MSSRMKSVPAASASARSDAPERTQIVVSPLSADDVGHHPITHGGGHLGPGAHPGHGGFVQDRFGLAYASRRDPGGGGRRDYRAGSGPKAVLQRDVGVA